MVRESGDYNTVIATISGEPEKVHSEKEAYLQKYPYAGYMTSVDRDAISSIDGMPYREIKIWRRASCD